MARHDALLRLHKTLLARRARLSKTLVDELANMHDFHGAAAPGDIVDAAFNASSDEMSSQLAELDSQELSQIERALERLQKGMYGMCEGGGENCQRKIPLIRLNALPYTTLCINCEREVEKDPGWRDQPARGNWNRVSRESGAPMEDRRINLSELEIGLSSAR
jgi:DnaK suppressor protein